MYTEDFNRFWDTFLQHSPSPKGSKKEAFLVWSELQSKDQLPVVDVVIKGVIAHANNDRYYKAKGQFVPSWKHGCRWLRNECWDVVDELEMERERRRRAERTQAEDYARRMEEERRLRQEAESRPSVNFHDFLRQRKIP